MFLFVLPSELRKYIEFRAEKDGTPKSEVVRKAIRERIKRDEEYADFWDDKTIRILGKEYSYKDVLNSLKRLDPVK